MSGQFPVSPVTRTVKVESNQPSLNSTSDSGKRQSRNAGGHLWLIDLKFPEMTRETFAPIEGFIMLQDGGVGEFTYILPTKKDALGVWGTVVSVLGAQLADDNTIIVDGLNVSVTDVVKAGDILTFSSHSKVYMIVESSNSDAGGGGSLSIRPPLIQDIADNEVITFTNVAFTVYADEVLEYKVSRQGFYTYSVKLIESL